MNNQCTIIMYHYVRNLKHNRYPEIKGLDLALFIEQIEYLKKNYQIITMMELINSVENGDHLPKKSVLLTFDDAYLDHYTNVFPILQKNKLEGSFFAPVRAITENKILDVNKIHFILSTSPDKEDITSEIFLLLNKYREEYKLETNEYYYNKLTLYDRYDSKEIVFIKLLLQVELNEKLRGLIVDELFKKLVSEDEISFSQELYMNTEQIECMHRNGMHIGGHGYDHYWLGKLSKELQEIELSKTMNFLHKINGKNEKWTIGYPYGSYNEDTMRILNELNCSLAFTTRVEIADLSRDNKLELPRLDTNDIPKDRNSALNDWYFKQNSLN